MLTEKQLIERKRGIGGSDAAAVIGLNPYKTPLTVYLEKRGEIESPDLSDNDAVHFGNVLEDIIAQEYARRTGNKVRKVNRMLQHRKHEFMLANVDRLVTGQGKVLECKTAGAHMRDHWGESGSDEVPEPYLIQVTHYMLVTGFSQADLAVLIGGRDFRIYHLQLDTELGRMLIEAEADFWRRVVEGDPPEPMTLADVNHRYRIDRTDSVTATPDIAEAAHDLAELKAWLSEAVKRKEDLELTIKKAMGDAGVLVDAYGGQLATWKAQTSRRLDSKAAQAALGQELAPYFKETTSRVFRLKGAN